ncbi:tripartite motif-containing protein 3-like, partial [Scleropages formosus]
MEFYCEPCETAMCLECTEGEHREHETVPLRDVLEQHKAALKDQLDAIRNRLPQLTTAIELVNEISRQLTERKNEAVHEIGSAFEGLERALHQRKAELVTDLESICSAKQKVLQAQLAVLLQGREHIQSSCSFTEQALSHGSATEVLLVRKQMSERVSALARHEFPEQAHENAHLDCLVETEGLRRSIQNLGVLLTTAAVGYTSVAAGEGLRHALVGQPATVTVTTKDKEGELVRTGNAELRAELLGPDGVCVEAEVTDNKNGTYEVGYTLRAEGEYSFSLLLYGRPVRGSPFRLRAVRPSDVPPSPDDVKRRVKSPSGSGGHVRQKAVRRPSSMYSTSKKKENPIEDELIFRVGGSRWCRHPRNISLRGRWNSRLFALDDVMCVRPLSCCVVDAGTRGREKGEFTNLQGISATSNGRVVVADSNNQCIQVFSNDGQFKLRFGVRGRSPGQLQRPTGVTVDTNGDIIVADYDNKWVSIFTSDGKFKNKIGAGRLMGPKGVAVDRNGHIITVDNKACCVFIFQPNGKLVTKFGAKGTSDRQFTGKE